MVKKVYINEDKVSLLQEYVTDKCFHFCDLESAKKILLSDEFNLRTNVVSRSEHWNQPKRRFFMCVTRNKSPYEGYSDLIMAGGEGVRLELDGEMLNYNYRGRPINFMARGHEKEIWSRDSSYVSTKEDSKTKYNQGDVENEDRIFSSRPIIPDAHKYIKRIDIVLPKNMDFGKRVYHFLNDLNPLWYQCIHFFHNLDDLFRNINEVNVCFPQKNIFDAQREALLRKKENQAVYNAPSHSIQEIIAYIGIISSYDKLLNGVETNPLDEATEISTRYGLEQFIQNKNQIFKEHNKTLNKDDVHILEDKIFEYIKLLSEKLRELSSFQENVYAQKTLVMATNFIRSLDVDTLDERGVGRGIKPMSVTTLQGKLKDKRKKMQ